jgi:hypothetical protein
MQKEYADKHNGLIDSGFDQEVRNHFKNKPLFSEAEMDNYNKLLNKEASPTSAAPSQAYNEGDTATNPKTGEQMMYVKGKWQKVAK